MKRRTFLGGAAAMALSSTSLAYSLARPLTALRPDNPYLKTIGLQLWTVRNELDMDKEATLKAIAQAGYHQVELMNTMDSDEVVKIAKDVGLQVTSAFFNWETIANPNAEAPTMDAVIEKASEFGLKHLVFGYIGRGHRESADHFKRHADAASIAGEKCKAADIQLCYHNHSFEFRPLEDNVSGFELFIERFHRDFVMFELDVFWAQISGWNAVNTLKKLDGRVSQVHLKDLKKGAERQFDEGEVAEDAFVDLGKGSIDMVRVIETCQEIGVQQCHVEQDWSASPLESIKTNHQFLVDLDEGKIKSKVPDPKAKDPFGG